MKSSSARKDIKLHIIPIKFRFWIILICWPSITHLYCWLTVTEYMCHKSPHICFASGNHNQVLSSFMTYHRVNNKSNTTTATCGEKTAFHFGPSEFTTDFQCVRVARSLVFYVLFCRLLFVVLSFWFWPLCCVFPNLRPLINILVSSNFSFYDINFLAKYNKTRLSFLFNNDYFGWPTFKTMCNTPIFYQH